MKKRLFQAFLLIAALSFQGFSQSSVKDSSIFMTLLYANYSYMFPGGDLAERYGGTSEIGGGIEFKTKRNWIIGAEGNYIFGGKVRNEEGLLTNIATANGFIIDANGYLADVLFSERGYSICGRIGKVIPAFGPNPNSGIMVVTGLGYLQNKIRIHNPGNTAPQVYGDYRKGYDRLNGGFSLNASAGYLYISNSRLLNFYLGFEFTQAWTKSKRDRDFDTGLKDTKNYSSQWYGIRVNWMIPLFRRTPKEYYLY